MNAFCATLARIEPTLTFRPATDDPEDRATAEVAHRAIEVCEDECDVRNVRQELSAVGGLHGRRVARERVRSSPEHGMRLVQDDACPACGATGPPSGTGTCAACGGPTVPAVDEAGQPVGHDEPIGRMYTEVCTIFEMYFDAAHTNWKTGVREYGRKKSSDRVTLERRWGKDAVEGVTSDTGLTVGEAYQDQLPTLAGYQPEIGPGAGLLSRTGLLTQRISEFYYWALPTRRLSRGPARGRARRHEGRAPRAPAVCGRCGPAVSADGVFPDRSRAGLAVQQNARG